jgi:hypothetical protein
LEEEPDAIDDTGADRTPHLEERPSRRDATPPLQV